jgi:transmembrane sensor
MKEEMNTEKYSAMDWEHFASYLSGEKEGRSELLEQFMSEDRNLTGTHWQEIRNMSGDKEIDVDAAWNKVYSRFKESETMTMANQSRPVFAISSTFMKIAAAVLVLLGLGVAALYLGSTDFLSKKITVATDVNQKNLEVTLPDGSFIVLNRKTELSYRSNFGKSGRKVDLRGEAFFNIVSDAVNPFTVDAGSALVKVLGTSFNVITSNANSAVEVFVKTGQVMLSDNSGDKTIVLDPGYVGTIGSKLSGKSLNNNLNYMAWNTGSLIYDGQTLDIVFMDLKRVYNMEIIADDPAILRETWTSPINNQPQDTIIRLICASFNLSYSKDGNVYHLSKK